MNDIPFQYFLHTNNDLPNSSGDQFRATYALNANRSGLVATGKIDIQKEIDSHLEETDIYTQIRKLIDNPSLIGDIVGSDVVDLPDSLVDFVQISDRARKSFNDLMKSDKYEQITFNDFMSDPSKLKLKSIPDPDIVKEV